MQTNFEFQNLLGVVYKRGNLLFTPDGNSLISPIGGRVSVFDLVNNRTYTFPFEMQSDITGLGLSPDGNQLFVAAGVSGRVVYFPRGVILFEHNFKSPISCISYSPNGKLYAVGTGTEVQIFRTAPLLKQYAPSFLIQRFHHHSERVTCLSWSPDSLYIMSGSADMSARIYSVYDRIVYEKDRNQVNEKSEKHTFIEDNVVLPPSMPLPKKTRVFGGHKEKIVACFLTKDPNTVITVSKDATLFIWKFEDKKWIIATRKHFQMGSAVTMAKLHPSENMIIVAFTKGFFTTYDLPDLRQIATLKISKHKITALTVNSTGEWFAVGVAKVGSLLVWEWQSERYILKQRGHPAGLQCLAYGHEGKYIATGGNDNKLKIWKVDDGFGFVTFDDHTGPITGIDFSSKKQVVVSCSRDGTVRAFDLIRYRNFRILTSPQPRNFNCVSVDPSGDVIAAGCSDSFEVYLWSLQTGNLIDVLEGHTGPISSLAFNPAFPALATASWDTTVKMWDVFSGNKTHRDSFAHNLDVMALAFRPDGKELVTAALDGDLYIWDPLNDRQIGLISSRKDISAGRAEGSLITAKGSSKGAHFTTLCYTADGECVIAGGKTRYICIYNIENRSLVRRFQICHNTSISGVVDRLDSRNMSSAAGPYKLIDDQDSDDDLYIERRDKYVTALPGVQKGFFAGTTPELEVNVTSIQFSPTGRQWACCTTEGLMIYGLDSWQTNQEGLFDPYRLDLTITTKSIYDTLMQKQYLKSLIMSLKLNEDEITSRVFESIPFELVQLLAAEMTPEYLPRFISFLSRYICPRGSTVLTTHVHYCLHWVQCLFKSHGQYFKHNGADMTLAFRSLQKSFTRFQEDLSQVSTSNLSTLTYLCVANQQVDLKTRQKILPPNNKKDNLMSKMEIVADEQSNESSIEDLIPDPNLPGWG